MTREKTFKTILTLILYLTILPSIAFAGRPLSIGDAGTIGKTHVEIECAVEYADATDDEFTLAATLTYGLLEKLDIAVELPYKYIDVHDEDEYGGLGDVVISSKYFLLEETGNLPAMAVSAGIKLKTGNDDKELGTGENEYSAIGILTKELGNIAGGNIIANLNFGYTYKDESQDDVFSYGVALEYPFNDKLNLVGEVAGETDFEEDFNDNAFAALLGFNYAFLEMAKFDFGMAVGISEASPDYTVKTGITLSF